ncbi:hypothetical protein Sjap_023309 [Stephania japonica]|uniref:Uncharacterized protein n=1 Tax=Stephania japonica TaxID=461633 RepID=A0AAP0HMJ7_9MAGN
MGVGYRRRTGEGGERSGEDKMKKKTKEQKKRNKNKKEKSIGPSTTSTTAGAGHIDTGSPRSGRFRGFLQGDARVSFTRWVAYFTQDNSTYCYKID